MTTRPALAPEHLMGHLQQWAAGSYKHSAGRRPASTLSVQAGSGPAAALLGPALLDDETRVIIHEDERSSHVPGVHIGYEGDLREGDDELVVGEGIYLQQQTYVSSSFLAVAGPTVVRVWTQADYDAFLEDADAALGEGRFQDNLTHPLVQLADLCVLGTRHPCAGSARLHVDRDGALRTTPAGASLVQLRDARDPAQALARALDSRPADPCLPEELDVDRWVGARTARPWLSRYLDALGALKRLHGEASWAGVRVSGFGNRLLTGLPQVLSESDDAPLLLHTDRQVLAVDPASWRVLRLGPDAARLLEAALVTGSPEGAVLAAREHYASRTVGDEALRAALDSVLTQVRAAGMSVGGRP